jgi:hypothetical protein
MGLPQVWLEGKTMGDFSKSQQWFGQDKQLSTSNLIFNKITLIGSGSRQTEY